MVVTVVNSAYGPECGNTYGNIDDGDGDSVTTAQMRHEYLQPEKFWEWQCMHDIP